MAKTFIVNNKEIPLYKVQVNAPGWHRHEKGKHEFNLLLNIERLREDVEILFEEHKLDLEEGAESDEWTQEMPTFKQIESDPVLFLKRLFSSHWWGLELTEALFPYYSHSSLFQISSKKVVEVQTVENVEFDGAIIKIIGTCNYLNKI